MASGHDVEVDPNQWLDDYIATLSSDEEVVEKDMPEEEFKTEMAAYYREVDESDGFEVGAHQKLFEEVPGLIHQYYYPPAGKTVGLPEYIELNDLAQTAINHFNMEKGTCYNNVIVLRANTEPVKGVFFYMTIQATDKSTETFQSKMYVGIPTTHVEVKFVRIKSTN